uniref:Uncharacterized protein n=1 Tax=Anguilla anguilla TaxID=7936 RepID=A0A0E9QKQ5_ANGAN
MITPDRPMQMRNLHEPTRDISQIWRLIEA